MEARFFPAAVLAACLLSLGASHRTQYFITSAPTPELAREIGETAEKYRRDLALLWLGRELPEWADPCPIIVQEGPRLGAGGATSFTFVNGQPRSWRMSIQGPRERILDSVLPHEITHTVFATHFGRPLPRWADEGACTTVEDDSERAKQDRLLIQFLTTDRGIAFNRMFAMTEYPADIMPLYSQGYSLARYLIAQGGRRKFVDYVGEGMKTNNWTAATQQHYGFVDLSQLQVTWLDWVRRGSPPLPPRPGTSPPVDTVAATAGNAPPAKTTPPLVAGASPPAAETASAGSWYARQAGRPRTGEQAAGAVAAATPKAAAAGPPAETAVTRPPPAQTPRQTILEWSRTGSPTALPPANLPAFAPVGAPAAAPAAYPSVNALPPLAAPPAYVPAPAALPSGTMWR